MAAFFFIHLVTPFKRACFKRMFLNFFYHGIVVSEILFLVVIVFTCKSVLNE